MRAEQWNNTCGALKSPSESIRLKLLVREENRGNFTPALALLSWPAACSGGGGESTECHIHLDFYECFDSSPKDTPLTRWRVFIQACQTSKKMRWSDISWFPLLWERERKSIILIATGNNYLVDSGKWVTWRHPTLITRCEGRLVATDVQGK